MDDIMWLRVYLKKTEAAKRKLESQGLHPGTEAAKDWAMLCSSIQVIKRNIVRLSNGGNDGPNYNLLSLNRPDEQ